jgi:cyclic lactone autoinducer peptide
MKYYIAKLADKVLTFVAKKQALTGCFVICNSQEIPEELL